MSKLGPTACLAISRSTRPNFIPRSSQFTLRRDFGLVDPITTPTKASQPGTALTSATIASSSSAVVIGTRVALGVCPIKRSPACRTGSKEGVCAETPTISHEPCVPTVIGVTMSAVHLLWITRSAERVWRSNGCSGSRRNRSAGRAPGPMQDHMRDRLTEQSMSGRNRRA